MARRIVLAEDVRSVAPGGELEVPSEAIITETAKEAALDRGVRLRVGQADAESATSHTTAAPQLRRVAIASDHGGYELKAYLKRFLAEAGYGVDDLGTNSTDSVDYPDFARAVAEAVAAGQAWRGIMIDAAGIGSAIAANKVPGVRASLCYDRATARNSREHNDANVLTLGARMLRAEEAREIVAVWLATPFAGGRHQRRIEKIAALEHPARESPRNGDARASLVDEITAEVVRQLSEARHDVPELAPSEDAECPACGGHCVESCPEKARRILSAGAARLASSAGVSKIPADLAATIDHTLLKPEASREQILQLCREAREFGFATVCVNPAWVSAAAAELRGSPVKVCTVAGFPLGSTLTSAKVFEAEQSIKLGATEIDMVMNVGALKSRELERVEGDIRSVAEACHRGGAILKVILECALLDDEEKVIASCLAQNAGADFVKTSTGFGPGGATAHDVELMRLAVGREMGVKAAGGIRSYEDLKKMLSAGATRIGASASVKILREASGAVPPAGPSFSRAPERPGY